MIDSPAYAHLLKRRPAQARSALRVEAILDAAAELLRDREPEAVTVRDLAVGAGVPTGTLYQFFEDKDAVLQALAVRFVAAMPGVLDGVLDQEDGDWSRTVGRVVDGYAALVRGHPAIRRLWLSGTLDSATRRLEQEADATIAARLGTLLGRQAGTRRGSAAEWRALTALIDGLLRHAFTEDPEGDKVALREARRAARAYAGLVRAEPRQFRPYALETDPPRGFLVGERCDRIDTAEGLDLDAVRADLSGTSLFSGEGLPSR